MSEDKKPDRKQKNRRQLIINQERYGKEVIMKTRKNIKEPVPEKKKLFQTNK